MYPWASCRAYHIENDNDDDDEDEDEADEENDSSVEWSGVFGSS